MPALPLRPLAAALLTALAAAAGCGEPDPVAVSATPLRLTMTEYRIEPQAVRIPAGRVEILVRNGGTTVHRLQLRSADRSRALASSPPLRPGESARVVVELAPGTYVDTCMQARHDTLGEHGTIVAR